MNIVLFDDGDHLNTSSPNRISIADRRANHILDVLKLSKGSRLRVGRVANFDDNGAIDTGIGIAEIVDIENRRVTFEFETLDQPPPPTSPVELILALPRPKSLKRSLRAIANLGIKSVHLIHSIRVEKPYWTAPALDPKIMREALLDGLSIARDTVMPRVRLHRLFKPFAQDIAPHLARDIAFVAHPSVDHKHLDFRTDFSKADSKALIPIAIGPEGGFSEYEVGLLNEAGFKNLSLGPRIYSVECAVPVIEALIQSEKREHDGRREYRKT